MKINVVKHNGKLVPATDQDREKLSKLGQGEYLTVEIKKVRNPKFHRKYFALVNFGFENQEDYANQDHYRKAMQVMAGYSVPVIFPTKTDEQKRKMIAWLKKMLDNLANAKPVILPFPKSIAFEKMDETEFEGLFSLVLDVICNHLDLSKEDMRSEIAIFTS